jgi:hypothetical protein
VDANGDLLVTGTRVDAQTQQQTGFTTVMYPDGTWRTDDFTDVGPGGGVQVVGLIFHRVNRDFVVGDIVYASGRRDGFVARFDPVTHRFLQVQGFHNFFGGNTSATAVDFDILGRVYVTGWTIGANGRQNLFLIRLDPNDLRNYFYQIYDLPLFGQPANACGLNLHVGLNNGPFHVDISGLIATPNGSIRRTFVVCVDTTNVMPPWRLVITVISAPDISFGNFVVRLVRDPFGNLRRVLFVEANRVRGPAPGSSDEVLIELVANPDTQTFDQAWSYDYPGRQVTSISVGDSGDLFTTGSEGSQAFVDRFSPDGSQLLSETLLGGQTGPSSALDVLETGGNMYISGLTQASDFPTLNAFQGNLLGTQDAFIAKYDLLFEPQALQVQGPPAVTAGAPFNVTVTVVDQQNHIVPGYDGDVHFTSSDGQATLPADYTFTTGTGSDNGSHTFTGVVLQTAGTQTVTADDLESGLVGTLPVQVIPGPASHFGVGGFPSPITVGIPGSFTVTALDASNNVATGYTGTVHFSSTDPQATLPGDYQFTPADAGTHTFTATLRTPAQQSIAATDLATGFMGIQVNIVVQPAGLIVNGDFETGDFTGWTQSGDTSYTGVSGDAPHSGRYAANLGPINGEGFLAQTFATTAGVTYTLDYWLAHDGGTPNSFRALINGANVPGSVLTDADAFAYREYTFTFAAAGATTELKFGFMQVPAYYHLDDVSVNRNPEPPGGGAGHAALVSATLAPVQALAGGRGVPVELAPGSSGGSRLRTGQGGTLAALPLQAFGGGLPGPFSATGAFDRPGAARRPAPRGDGSASAALDGLFTRLGEGTIAV